MGSETRMDGGRGPRKIPRKFARVAGGNIIWAQYATAIVTNLIFLAENATFLVYAVVYVRWTQNATVISINLTILAENITIVLYDRMLYNYEVYISKLRTLSSNIVPFLGLDKAVFRRTISSQRVVRLRYVLNGSQNSSPSSHYHEIIVLSLYEGRNSEQNENKLDINILFS